MPSLAHFLIVALQTYTQPANSSAKIHLYKTSARIRHSIRPNCHTKHEADHPQPEKYFCN